MLNQHCIVYQTVKLLLKAIVERLKKAYDEKGWLNESGAKYPVEVAILKDNVLLTIDTSGSGLNRRGYRIAQGKLLLKKPWQRV